MSENRRCVALFRHGLCRFFIISLSQCFSTKLTVPAHLSPRIPAYLLPQMLQKTPIQFYYDRANGNAHVSKARRTDRGRIVVETATVPTRDDDLATDLHHSITVHDRSVEIDSAKALHACRKHKLIDERQSSFAIAASSSRLHPHRGPLPPNSSPGGTSDQMLQQIPQQTQAAGIGHDNSDKEHAMPISQPVYDPAIVSITETRRRGRPAWAHLTEEDKLSAAIRLLDQRFANLCTPRAVDDLRTVHCEFACHEASLLSASVRERAPPDEENGPISRYVGFMWQVKFNPPSLVTVTLFLSGDAATPIRSYCTCTPSRSEKCIHSEAILCNASITAKITSLLQGEE